MFLASHAGAEGPRGERDAIAPSRPGPSARIRLLQDTRDDHLREALRLFQARAMARPLEPDHVLAARSIEHFVVLVYEFWVLVMIVPAHEEIDRYLKLWGGAHEIH